MNERIPPSNHMTCCYWEIESSSQLYQRGRAPLCLHGIWSLMVVILSFAIDLRRQDSTTITAIRNWYE